MAIFAGAGLPTLGVVALTLVKLVFGETDAGIVMSLLSGLLPAVLVTRTLWSRTTQAWRGRLVKILDAMSEETTKALGDGESDAQRKSRAPWT